MHLYQRSSKGSLILLFPGGQAYAGHSHCLKVLLSHGASVDATSQGGVTALIAAAEGRSGDCTRVLLNVNLCLTFANLCLPCYT